MPESLVTINRNTQLDHVHMMLSVPPKLGGTKK